MNKKLWLYALEALCGALAIYLGGFFSSQEMKQVSGMLFGLGAAAFCLGIGNIIAAKIVSPRIETPEILRLKNIEVNDERNVRIKEKVGARINQIVVYALSLIVIVLGFMNADLVIILMVSSLFLLELVLLVVLTSHYSKQM